MMSAKPVVFVVRLTAIGDTLITARALAQLHTAGFDPVLVTAQAHEAIFEALTPTTSCLLVQDTGELLLTQKKELPPAFQQSQGSQCHTLAPTQKKTFEHWLEHLAQQGFKNYKYPILDLQNTARSRRAIGLLKKKLGASAGAVQKVPKRTLFRIFLMVLAYLKFSQKVLAQPFQRAHVVSIHDIQRTFVRAFIAKHQAQTKSQISEGALGKRVLSCLALADAGLPEFVNKKYVAVFPGASGPLKTWPKENYRACLEHLLAHTTADIVVCGGPAEAEIAKYLQYSSPDRIYNKAGAAPLRQTLSLIAHAQHVLTGDSFATHAADLAGVSATVLFGGTSPKFGFVPLSAKIELRYENLACSPCTRHGKGTCRFQNLKCLAGIDGTEIGKRIAAQLQ